MPGGCETLSGTLNESGPGGGTLERIVTRSSSTRPKGSGPIKLTENALSFEVPAPRSDGIVAGLYIGPKRGSGNHRRNSRIAAYTDSVQELQLSGSMPILSLTAARMRCLQPRYPARRLNRKRVRRETESAPVRRTQNGTASAKLRGGTRPWTTREYSEWRSQASTVVK
jgi:hypothetical protein